MQLHVELVDNASPDDSFDVLDSFLRESGFESWVHLTRAPRNGGFSYGNNIGIELARKALPNAKYLLLLNPDIVVQHLAFLPMIDFLDRNPNVGIVGSRLEELDGMPQISAFRFPTFWSEVDAGLRFGFVSNLLSKHLVAPPVRTESHRTDWVAGASMLVRTDVLDDVGLLDEHFFMYYEEVDFCRRAALAGWECWYVPESRVVHLVGQASGINSADKKPKQRPSYVHESRRRYFQKHHGRLYAILADLAWLTSYPLWRLRRFIQRKPDTDPPQLWWDTLRHSSLFHGIDRTSSR